MAEPAPVRPGNADRNDYPRMLYHPDGRTTVVEDAAAHDRHARDGWDTVPADIHRERAATQTPMQSGGEPLAQLIREVMESVLDERGFVRQQPTRRRGDGIGT